MYECLTMICKRKSIYRNFQYHNLIWQLILSDTFWAIFKQLSVSQFVLQLKVNIRCSKLYIYIIPKLLKLMTFRLISMTEFTIKPNLMSKLGIRNKMSKSFTITVRRQLQRLFFFKHTKYKFETLNDIYYKFG